MAQDLSGKHTVYGRLVETAQVKLGGAEQFSEHRLRLIGPAEEGEHVGGDGQRLKQDLRVFRLPAADQRFR